jgi:hypothetical protein
MTTYISDTDVADNLIRIFHGTPDDFNPIAPCKRFVERLRGAGHDVVPVPSFIAFNYRFNMLFGSIACTPLTLLTVCVTCRSHAKLQIA